MYAVSKNSISYLLLLVKILVAHKKVKCYKERKIARLKIHKPNT